MDPQEGPTTTTAATTSFPPSLLLECPEISPIGSLDHATDEAHEVPSEDDQYHDLDHGPGYGDEPPAVGTGGLGEDLKCKVIQQVEYYFSDENLPTDKNMISLIRKNKEGFDKYFSQVTLSRHFPGATRFGCAEHLRLKLLVPLPAPLGLVQLGKWYLLLTSFCLVSMGNGVNLTDGLDGLAGGTAALAFYRNVYCNASNMFWILGSRWRFSCNGCLHKNVLSTIRFVWYLCRGGIISYYAGFVLQNNEILQG